MAGTLPVGEKNYGSRSLHCAAVTGGSFTAALWQVHSREIVQENSIGAEIELPPPQLNAREISKTEFLPGTAPNSRPTGANPSKLTASTAKRKDAAYRTRVSQHTYEAGLVARLLL